MEPKHLNLGSRDFLVARLREWRRRFGYYSILAAVPAILGLPVSDALCDSDSINNKDVSLADLGMKSRQKFNFKCSNSRLLKQQSRFQLPHQNGAFDLFTALGENDDCPGRQIPDGIYTFAVPFIDSGDTTGANDTVTNLAYFYYYNVFTRDAHGPDHIYSFTMTARGENPQIQVSTTSTTFKPVIYILDECPSGTGATRFFITWSDSANGVATINRLQFSSLHLNVPLHLFIDSPIAGDSGPYTLRIQDVTIGLPTPSPSPTPMPSPTPLPSPVPIDNPDVFVRQHYLDFLNREPDASGLAFWTNEITSCGSNPQCVELKRVNTSAAFFLSIEFQETGYLVYRMHKSAFGNVPGTPVPVRFNEFLTESRQVGDGVVVGIGNWQARLDANKQAYALTFVQRPEFLNAYPSTMSANELITLLDTNAGSVLSTTEKNELIGVLGSTPADVSKRAAVLRAVAENSQLRSSEFNRAFVLMEYFGYLRRNPNDAPDSDFFGYDFWLAKLDSFGGNFINAEMVKAFIFSTEYRRRFGM